MTTLRLAQIFEDIRKLNLVEKLKALDSRARRKGLESLDPSRNSLIGIGMEIDGRWPRHEEQLRSIQPRWQAETHPEWPGLIHAELAEIRKRLREAHGVPLRYVIWTGMGGSAEDKVDVSAIGLLRRGPRVYVLDSTDPSKLKSILADIERRCRVPLAQALKSTLVVGMAMGMTSYEPVVNLEKLATLYERHKIDSRPNFLYMTLPNSLLDKAGASADTGASSCSRWKQLDCRAAQRAADARQPISARTLRRRPSRMDPLGTVLSRASIDMALQLACFLDTQARPGRNKVTLLLPKEWAGAGIWTKQDFEESLGNGRTSA